VFRAEGEDVVYVYGEEIWQKRAVETGERNRKNVIITKGLEGEEELLLEEPKSQEEEQPQGPALMQTG